MDPVTVFSVVETLRRASKAKGVMGMFGMRNLLALVGLAVVAFAVAGWYLGWYNFKDQQDANGEHHVTIQVNTTKFTQDASKGLAQGEQKLIMVLDKEKGTITQAPAPPAQGPGQAPVQSYSLPLVPRSVAEVHVTQPAQPAAPPPVQTPRLEIPPPPPGVPQPVDSFTYPR
jgi:hypothetical protein